MPNQRPGQAVLAIVIEAFGPGSLRLLQTQADSELSAVRVSRVVVAPRCVFDVQVTACITSKLRRLRRFNHVALVVIEKCKQWNSHNAQNCDGSCSVPMRRRLSDEAEQASPAQRQ